MIISRRGKIVGGLVVIEGILSFFAWQSVSRAVLIDGASDWIIPILFFLGTAPLLMLIALLSKNVFLRTGGVVMFLIPAWYFSQSFAMIFFSLGAGILLFRGMSMITNDVRNQVKVRIFQGAKKGIFSFVLGVSLMTTGLYVALIAGVPPEKLLPKFTFSDGAGRIALRMMEKANPNVRTFSEGGMSVDMFLSGFLPKEEPVLKSDEPSDERTRRTIEFLKNSGIQMGNSQELSRSVAVEQEKLFLLEGKRRLSDMLGRTVRGDESMLDLFSELLNGKIFAFANVQGQDAVSPSVLRTILSIFLFLTLLSLGSLIGPLWACLTWIFFKIAQSFGVVGIRKTLREVEDIDEASPEEFSTQQ